MVSYNVFAHIVNDPGPKEWILVRILIWTKNISKSKIWNIAKLALDWGKYL
jgi:hypothetical protein